MIDRGRFEGLLDFVLPRGCVVCRGWMPGRVGHFVCSVCRSRYRAAPWPRCERCHHPAGTGRSERSGCLECSPWPDTLQYARYGYALQGPAGRVVHALKYDGWAGLASEMGSVIAAAVADLDPPDVVTWVPTTERRRRERGYDQAELLARSTATILGRPCRRLLRRREAATSQVRLDPLERRQNVRDAFSPSGTVRLDAARVLVVDDVLTTGATGGAAASELAAAGAGGVTLGTFARALPRLEARRGQASVA